MTQQQRAARVPADRRVASVVRLRPDRAEEYLELHRAVWPEVRDALTRAGISDYSIFLRDGLLFGTYDWSGTDFEGSHAALAEDPAVRRWWERTDPCQEPLPTAAPGQLWAPAVEIFRHD